MKTATELGNETRTKLEECKAIAERADNEGREFTPSEKARVRTLLEEAKNLRDQAGDADLREQMADLGRGTRGRDAAATSGSWAKAYRDWATRNGVKDITPSGSITTPAVSDGIATLEDRPRTFLQAISFVSLDATDSFDVVREVGPRLNAAASVKPGDLKPTTQYQLEKRTERARTVAHLSEPIDRIVLDDSETVATFLETVMRAGVELALEDMVLKGDSTVVTRDDFDGIFNTSGIAVQPFATDTLTTARKALTRLQQANLAGPFVYVMNAATWEAYELLKDAEQFVMGDAGASPGQRVPVDAARQALWGQRVALSEGLDDGEALLGDFSPASIRARNRQGTTIEWSEAAQVALSGSGGASATGFQTNQRVFRAEARVGLELRRPWAFCTIDLTA